MFAYLTVIILFLGMLRKIIVYIAFGSTNIISIPPLLLNVLLNIEKKKLTSLILFHNDILPNILNFGISIRLSSYLNA